jgi:hypothetical protein
LLVFLGAKVTEVEGKEQEVVELARGSHRDEHEAP